MFFLLFSGCLPVLVGTAGDLTGSKWAEGAQQLNYEQVATEIWKLCKAEY